MNRQALIELLKRHLQIYASIIDCYLEDTTLCDEPLTTWLSVSSFKESIEQSGRLQAQAIIDGLERAHPNGDYATIASKIQVYREYVQFQALHYSLVRPFIKISQPIIFESIPADAEYIFRALIKPNIEPRNIAKAPLSSRGQFGYAAPSARRVWDEGKKEGRYLDASSMQPKDASVPLKQKLVETEDSGAELERRYPKRMRKENAYYDPKFYVTDSLGSSPVSLPSTASAPRVVDDVNSQLVVWPFSSADFAHIKPKLFVAPKYFNRSRFTADVSPNSVSECATLSPPDELCDDSKNVAM